MYDKERALRTDTDSNDTVKISPIPICGICISASLANIITIKITIPITIPTIAPTDNPVNNKYTKLLYQLPGKKNCFNFTLCYASMYVQI